jgi:lysophospholipase L1-like esterase
MQGTKSLFMELDTAEHPNYPVGSHDNTHFNEYGARRIAELVLIGIKEQKLELATKIVTGTNKPSVNPQVK